MSRAIVFTLALSLVVASLAAPAVAASTPTTAEDGGTYETGAALAFELDGGDSGYEVRTAEERLLVRELRANDGTATLDTEAMDPGEYLLVDPESGDVVFEFTLVAEKTETATPTATATATPTATDTASPPSTTTEAPGFGVVAAVVAVFGLAALGRDR